MPVMLTETKKGMIKTDEALITIREGGKLLGQILEKVAGVVRPGITTLALSDLAEKLIREAGGRPSFLGYKISAHGTAYPAGLCVSVNDEVVHGIPRAKRVLQDGDVVGLDIGMEWPYNKNKNGFYTDTAVSVAVGKISKEDSALMSATYAALLAGIQAAAPHKTVADISRAIESVLKPYGYGIVRDLVGHGVGYAVHEDPPVPNFVDKRLSPVLLVPGMVLALEPMVNRGGGAVETAADGWTVRTRDHSRSAHFEHTIIITDSGADIVTLRPLEA